MAEESPSTPPLSLEQQLQQRDAKISRQAEEILRRDALIMQLQHKVGVLEIQVRRLLRGRFTPSSETIIPDPCQQQIEEVVPIPGEQPPPLIELPTTATTASRPRNKPRRRLLSEMFPELVVNEVHLTLPLEEQVDADGTRLTLSGTFVNEQLVWHPSAPGIRRTIRHRYGRSDTGEKVTAAPALPCILPRGILADETIHALVVSHVLDALPWHRQECISERVGCRIPRSVMTNCWAAWCQLMNPLMEAIKASVLAKPVIAADSTVMPHQNGEKKQRCAKTGIWAVTDGTAVFFHWTEDMTHARVKEVLGGYTGTLIRDEWEGWKRLLDWMPEGDPPPALPGISAEMPSPVAMAGCNAHARRRFVDFQEIDSRADIILKLYRQLYAIEGEAVARWMLGENLVAARTKVRQERSPAIWAPLVQQAIAITAHMSPSTAFYQAANYIVKYRLNLERFLTDGRVPIDNNLTENVLRIVALIRKNRLFLGRCEEAGPRMAIGLTILRSCHLAGLNPLDYLARVTPTLLEYRNQKELGRLLPDLTGLLPLALARPGQHRRLGISSIASMA